MKYFFSPSTTAMFRSDINGEPGSEGNSLAADVVEVASELYEQMLIVREKGGRVIPGEDGMPKEAPPVPLTVDEQGEKERRWRDSQLTLSEWVVARHRDQVDMRLETAITAEQFSGLLKYRQALRDWPFGRGFPDAGQRPSAPTWLDKQVQ